jgi:hypothetical protein
VEGADVSTHALEVNAWPAPPPSEKAKPADQRPEPHGVA